MRNHLPVEFLCGVTIAAVTAFAAFSAREWQP